MFTEINEVKFIINYNVQKEEAFQFVKLAIDSNLAGGFILIYGRNIISMKGAINNEFYN